MIPFTHTIDTENLLLRPPRLSDISTVFSATRYAGFNDGMPWDPPKSEDEMIEPHDRALKAWRDGSGYSFSIDKKPDLTFCGRISIRRTNIADRWNIGFWTHPAYQGHGIMTEAVGGVLKFGFDSLQAHEIEACYAIWNMASEKVLQYNGFKFEKYLEKGFLKKGQWVAENLMVVDRSNWMVSDRIV